MQNEINLFFNDAVVSVGNFTTFEQSKIPSKECLIRIVSTTAPRNDV